MFVYLVKCLVNGKKYVGQHSGKDLNQYWKRCVIHAINGNHGKNRLLYRAIRKHGSENFSIEPLVIVSSKPEMDLYETGMIAALELCNPEKGYNLAAGGRGTVGYKFSEEALKNLSEGHKGLKQSEETKRKHAEAIRGFKHTEETRKRMSDAQLGNTNGKGTKRSQEFCDRQSERTKGNKLSVGAIRSPEYLKNLSESQKGRRFSEEHRHNHLVAQRRRREREMASKFIPRSPS